MGGIFLFFFFRVASRTLSRSPSLFFPERKGSGVEVVRGTIREAHCRAPCRNTGTSLLLLLLTVRGTYLPSYIISLPSTVVNLTVGVWYRASTLLHLQHLYPTLFFPYSYDVPKVVLPTFLWFSSPNYTLQCCNVPTSDEVLAPSPSWVFTFSAILII